MTYSFNNSRRFFDCPPNCPERRPACQDHCERYLKKRAELDALNAAERRRRDIATPTIDAVLNNRDKTARKNRDHSKHRRY